MDDKGGKRHMIFMIKYQTQKDSADPHSNFKRSFFAENPSSPPRREMIRNLVDCISGGDFDDDSIEFEEWLETDAEKMKRVGITVHKLT
jgi:hypothetical protein